MCPLAIGNLPGLAILMVLVRVSAIAVAIGMGGDGGMLEGGLFNLGPSVSLLRLIFFTFCRCNFAQSGHLKTALVRRYVRKYISSNLEQAKQMLRLQWGVLPLASHLIVFVLLFLQKSQFGLPLAIFLDFFEVSLLLYGEFSITLRVGILEYEIKIKENENTNGAP